MTTSFDPACSIRQDVEASSQHRTAEADRDNARRKSEVGDVHASSKRCEISRHLLVHLPCLPHTACRPALLVGQVLCPAFIVQVGNTRVEVTVEDQSAIRLD